MEDAQDSGCCAALPRRRQNQPIGGELCWSAVPGRNRKAFGATWLTYPDLASRAEVIFSTVMSRKGFVKLCLEMRSHFSKRIPNWPIRNAKSPSARGTTPVGASRFVDQQQFAWPSWLGLIVHSGLNMHKQVTSLLKTATKMVGQRRVTFQPCLS